MGVKLNICLLLLVVATVSLQGFKLREKNDDTDENPFRLRLLSVTQCARFGGRCIPNPITCPPNTFICTLTGCPSLPKMLLSYSGLCEQVMPKGMKPKVEVLVTKTIISRTFR
ncbi:PREDICTED: small cysteine-rich protein 1 2-like isoform X1 [Acropora digitifera]|uniref:small cysteine-rich protein 1 2-like isoform X1 n=1 Tax=Acropora digitifera TaxID=70779 RepID=UPI00077B266B|nr:PREDICTED: small cysteine-rich protein 1 2-like isoform X1 [Acropora digitifera]XP_015765735.1 PREDICTED: small cysteine-rich protein 1 2-like isoform X1 [Acropora digitifera]XP_015765736.1 PREDICTED: small cysteine-rich protein 1 2-like isoform X1 [Acropora digitifera]